MIKVICRYCKHKVGRFQAADDHGGVFVECPGCWKALFIPNGLLSEMENNPESFDNPSAIEADEGYL